MKSKRDVGIGCLGFVVDLILVTWFYLNMRNFTPQFYLDEARFLWIEDITRFHGFFTYLSLVGILLLGFFILLYYSTIRYDLRKDYKEIVTILLIIFVILGMLVFWFKTVVTTPFSIALISTLSRFTAWRSTAYPYPPQSPIRQGFFWVQSMLEQPFTAAGLEFVIFKWRAKLGIDAS